MERKGLSCWTLAEFLPSEFTLAFSSHPESHSPQFINPLHCVWHLYAASHLLRAELCPLKNLHSEVPSL